MCPKAEGKHPEKRDDGIANKGIKTAVIYIFHILKAVKENMSMMRREMEDVKKRLNGTSRDEKYKT